MPLHPSQAPPPILSAYFQPNFKLSIIPPPALLISLVMCLFTPPPHLLTWFSNLGLFVQHCPVCGVPVLTSPFFLTSPPSPFPDSVFLFFFCSVAFNSSRPLCAEWLMAPRWEVVRGSKKTKCTKERWEGTQKKKKGQSHYISLLIIESSDYLALYHANSQWSWPHRSTQCLNYIDIHNRLPQRLNNNSHHGRKIINGWMLSQKIACRIKTHWQVWKHS